MHLLRIATIITVRLSPKSFLSCCSVKNDYGNSKLKRTRIQYNRGSFAQKRFCGAEGIQNVITASDFATGDFGRSYGVELLDGPLRDLHARAVVVVSPDGIVKYAELVTEIANEPNYDAAIAAL